MTLGKFNYPHLKPLHFKANLLELSLIALRVFKRTGDKSVYDYSIWFAKLAKEMELLDKKQNEIK
jgi:hypothetical protein